MSDESYSDGHFDDSEGGDVSGRDSLQVWRRTILIRGRCISESSDRISSDRSPEKSWARNQPFPIPLPQLLPKFSPHRFANFPHTFLPILSHIFWERIQKTSREGPLTLESREELRERLCHWLLAELGAQARLQPIDSCAR
jgi:hypothetical protein